MHQKRGTVKPSRDGCSAPAENTPDESEPWEPTEPGPQGHNAGITPGYRVRDTRLVTRDDVQRLAAQLDADTAAAVRALAARIAYLERQIRQRKAG